MRRSTKAPPTDEEIMGYNGVPVEVAAKYLGIGRKGLEYALRQRCVTFGFAAEGEGTWYYNISPGGLVKYKRAGMELPSADGILRTLEDGTGQIMDAQLQKAESVIMKLVKKAVKENVGKMLKRVLDDAAA